MLLSLGTLPILRKLGWAAPSPPPLIKKSEKLPGQPIRDSSIRPPAAPPCTSAAKVAVEGFWVLPSSFKPQEGQRCELYMSIKNICNGALAKVPWRIDRFGETQASGVQLNVPAGQSFEVQAFWTATAGKHNFFGYADRDNTLGDAGLDRGTRYFKMVAGYEVAVVPHWPEWLSSAKQGTVEGIRGCLAGAPIKGVVNATTGKIPKGGISGCDQQIIDAIRRAMGGAPETIKVVFVGAVLQAWRQWASNYEVPLNPAAFPAFAAFPAAQAPRTPAIPPELPLRLGSSSGEGALSAANMAADIRKRLGSADAGQPGAEAAMNDFAQWFCDRLRTWIANAGICNIEGWGSVPSFAPPYVPVGPVVGGELSAKFCGPNF